MIYSSLQSNMTPLLDEPASLFIAKLVMIFCLESMVNLGTYPMLLK